MCSSDLAIARQIGAGPPPLLSLVEALEAAGHQAFASGLMAGQVRSDAPWPVVLAIARGLCSSEVGSHDSR